MIFVPVFIRKDNQLIRISLKAFLLSLKNFIIKAYLPVYFSFHGRGEI